MTHEEFLSLNIKPNCHVKVMWDNKVLLEGDGIIIEKANTDAYYQDIKVYGIGNKFLGWFRSEDVELINMPNNSNIKQQIDNARLILDDILKVI